MIINRLHSILICIVIFNALVSVCRSAYAVTNEATSIPVYITLDSMRTNQCNVSTPDISGLFLVHDGDGDILSTHHPDIKSCASRVTLSK